MSKTLSVTKYLTNVYRYVIFYLTLFCYTNRNMAIFFNFLKHGLYFKNEIFFWLFRTISRSLISMLKREQIYFYFAKKKYE